MRKTALITGITGQDGSYLAEQDHFFLNFSFFLEKVFQVYFWFDFRNEAPNVFEQYAREECNYHARCCNDRHYSKGRCHHARHTGLNLLSSNDIQNQQEMKHHISRSGNEASITFFFVTRAKCWSSQSIYNVTTHLFSDTSTVNNSRQSITS